MTQKIHLLLKIFWVGTESQNINLSAMDFKKNDRKTVTYVFLYEACSSIGETGGGMIPWFDCESYVYGVLDSYIATRNTIPIKQRACFPANLAPWEALKLSRKDEFTEWEWSRLASTVLIENLRKHYPCN